MRSSRLSTTVFGNLSRAERNRAIAFGFWVFGTSARVRTLIGLRFKTWVRARRGNLESRKGSALNSPLFKASYGSCPAQSFCRQYARSFRAVRSTSGFMVDVEFCLVVVV